MSDAPFSIPSIVQSHRSELNRRPLDYESSALPLSYCGGSESLCPGTDSNRDALRHHPLKMACLPISPPGPTSTASQSYKCQRSAFSDSESLVLRSRIA